MRTPRGHLGPRGVRTGRTLGRPTPGSASASAHGAHAHEEDVVDLRSTPGLGRLYAAGVLGSARAAAGGLVASVGASGRATLTVAPEDLPRTRLRLDGVAPDADHLTAYQHLLGEPAGDVLPAGFLHVMAFPVALALMVRSDFPLPLLGMVHVANRIEQQRAVRLGELLGVSVHPQDLSEHRAGVTVDVVAEITVDEVVVWQGVSTYLSKGVRLAGAPRRAADEASHGAEADEVQQGGHGDAASRSDDGDQASPAQRRPTLEPPMPTGQWRLPADVGRRYAAVSGDRNPIHLSTLAAKAFGFPRTIAHGMYTAARALADVGSARGESFVWEVEFGKPVLLPSTVAVRVAEDDAGPGYGFVVWDARRGRLHLSGRVTPLTSGHPAG